MSRPNAATSPARGWWIAAWALCLAGAVLRIGAYLLHRSLWYDEAALALNIAERGFLALLAPLDHLQAAPPLFLWAQRALVLLFGPSEWILRALPLGAAIVTLPLAWRVGRRLLSERPAVLAVALLALSPTLVRYAAEAKPYATDALLTLVLFDRAVAAAEPNASPRAWWILAAVGVVALLASTPAVFVLAGCVAFLAAAAARAPEGRSGNAIRRTALVAAGWAAAFAILLATVFRPLLGGGSAIGKYMHWYWSANFLTPDPPGLKVKILALLWGVLPGTFFGESPIRKATSLMVLAIAIGLVALIATRRWATILSLTVPNIALVGASALRRYPIAERLVLFAAPLSAMLVAASLMPLDLIRSRRVANWFAAGVTAAVAVLAALGLITWRSSPIGHQESRSLVRAAARANAEGTPVWVSGGAEAVWRYYTGTRPRVRDAGGVTADSSVGGRAFSPDLLLGEWYALVPERIREMPEDTAGTAKPSAWSEREAGRVRAIAKPCALVFLTHMMPGEREALFTSIAQQGGRVADSRRDVGAELNRVCFG